MAGGQSLGVALAIEGGVHVSVVATVQVQRREFRNPLTLEACVDTVHTGEYHSCVVVLHGELAVP